MRAATRQRAIDASISALQGMGKDGKALAAKLKRRPLLAAFVVNTLYSRWSAKNPGKGDGEFLKWLIEWFTNGGAEAIVKFIAAIVAIFV